jgi:hypothetical protein
MHLKFDRADGVFVDGVDDPEVIEHSGWTFEKERLEMVDQTSSNYIHIDLSAYLIESSSVYRRVSVLFRYFRAS